MAHLTTVVGTFHAQVLAARLGAEGIPVDLRGMSSGPYPLPGTVEVYVRADQLDLARELLLADAVDAAFDERYDVLEADGTGTLDLAPADPVEPPASRRVRTVLVFAMAAMVLLVGVLTAFR